MRPIVEEKFHDFSTPFEGRRFHMYLDIKKLVTTGVGNLLAAPEAATGIQFTHDFDGPASSAGDRSGGWATIKASLPGKPTSPTAKDYYGALCDLRAPGAEIDRLVLEMRNAFDNDNALQFSTKAKDPCYADYVDFCADAQLGLLSMQWPGHFNDFVNFKAAVRAGHWFQAARQCYFDSSSNPGLIPRNRANRLLFSMAGRLQRLGGDPNVLHYKDPGLNKVFLIKGGSVIRYDWDLDTVDSGLLDLSYFKLPHPFELGIDCCFNGYGVERNPKYFGKTYFFKGSQYVRYDWDTDTVDVNLPLSSWGLKDAWAQGIDAAINGYGKYAGKLYLFKGTEYVAFDWATNKLDGGPRSLAAGWNLPAPFDTGFDTVVNGEGSSLGKVFFFKGDKYVRFHWDPWHVDGAVKTIGSEWNGVTPFGFDTQLDAFVSPPGRF